MDQERLSLAVRAAAVGNEDGPRTMRIDAHAHLVPSALLETAEAVGSRHGIHVRRQATGGWVLDSADLPPRTIPRGLYEQPPRWDRMELQGVDLQVVSGWNELYGYNLPPRSARWWSRAQNDHLASAVLESGGRLAGLAVVPLQDVEASVVELRHAITTLGLAGAVIDGNVRGANLDEPELRPFWAALADLDCPLLVHPSAGNGLGAPRLRRYFLAHVIGIPVETTIAAASLLHAGLIREFGLRVMLVHGGGCLPFLMGRVRKSVVAGVGGQTAMTADAVGLDDLFFDSLLHDERALALLMASASPQRVMFGTDYPFEMAESRPAADAVVGAVSPDDLDRVLGGTARGFFRLPPAQTQRDRV